VGKICIIAMWVNEYKVSLEKWLPLHDVEEVVGVD
jgi:hypothetical protein